MTNKKFTIEYEQETPMGLNGSNLYKVTYTTNSAYNAMKRFESEHKKYIGYDWMGEPKSAYQITGWDIIAVDDVYVTRKCDEKTGKFMYVDDDGRKLA